MRFARLGRLDVNPRSGGRLLRRIRRLRLRLNEQHNRSFALQVSLPEWYRRAFYLVLARLVVKGFETRLKGRLATPPCPAPKRRGRPRTAPTHHTPSNGRARPSLSHAHHSAASLRRPPPPTVPTVASLQRGKTSSPQTTQVSREETDVRASVSLSRVSYARSRATHSSRLSTSRRGPA